MFSAQEIAIIKRLQEDLPLVPQPYAVLATQLGISEADLLKCIEQLQAQGVIRRLGAILLHRQAGMQGNVMVVWRVPPAEINRVGEILARSPAVTHCYERPTAPDWPYNLYSMVHARDEIECRSIVQDLALQVGLEDYQLLFTVKEFKKTSMHYFA